MEALNSNIEDIETKDIQVTGRNYADNTICSIDVNITDKTEAEKEPKTFGGKSLAAIESGWDVITSIFLFLLPLWPVFLIGGIGYYFYKKKKTVIFLIRILIRISKSILMDCPQKVRHF
jgi:hypothetical protein